MVEKGAMKKGGNAAGVGDDVGADVGLGVGLGVDTSGGTDMEEAKGRTRGRRTGKSAGRRQEGDESSTRGCARWFWGVSWEISRGAAGIPPTGTNFIRSNR